MNRFIPSHDSVTCRRSPEVSSTAFNAQPPDLPPVGLMDVGFAIVCSLARHRRPHHPVFVHRPACLLHASFRPRLAASVISPLRFAMTSPPSGCQRDFHPRAVERARHNRHRGESRLSSPATPPYMRVRIRRFSSVELERHPAIAEDRARRSKRQEKRIAGPDCSPVAKVREDCQRFAPQGQVLRSDGAVEQTLPSLASIASRSRIAACAGSILPAVAAPRASGSSRSNPSSPVSSWPVPSSSAPD